MGKAEGEHTLSLPNSPNLDHNSVNPCRFSDIFRVRCVLALLLGVSVLLSGLFWLPPFLNKTDRGDFDLSSNFGSYEIVVTFMLGKPLSLLEGGINKLEDDIFDEIEAPTVKVKILALVPTVGSNITKVLKFAGGITVISPQSVFLLQKIQMLFNFTLNNSINQTLEDFDALISQLKPGLRLASYENLYIKLTNPKGSTIAIPTILQTSVVLEIGNNPSQARLKQLAQTISHSYSRNLGLNNTIFGKVKQVHLSSILQHSLRTDISPTPTPPLTPAFPPAYKFHFPKIGKKYSPAPAPAPALVPSFMRGHKANTPGCHFGQKGRPKKCNKNNYFFPPEPPEIPEPALPPASPRFWPPAQREHDISPL